MLDKRFSLCYNNYGGGMMVKGIKFQLDKEREYFCRKYPLNGKEISFDFDDDYAEYDTICEVCPLDNFVEHLKNEL